MKMMITVSRTIQTAPYETSRVEVSETYTVPDEDVDAERDVLYARVTKAVNRYSKNERLKYQKEAQS